MARVLVTLLVPLFLAALFLLRPSGAAEGPAVGLTLLALATSGALVAYGARGQA